MTRLACCLVAVLGAVACGGGGGGSEHVPSQELTLQLRFTGAEGAPLPAGEPYAFTLKDFDADTTWSPDVAADGSASITVPALEGHAMAISTTLRDASLAETMVVWFSAAASVDLGTIDLGPEGVSFDAANTHTTAYPLSLCWTAYDGPAAGTEYTPMVCTTTVCHDVGTVGSGTCYSLTKATAADLGLGEATGHFGVFVRTRPEVDVSTAKFVIFDSDTFTYPATTP